MNPLINEIAQKLNEKNWMITTAESCSGGLIASALVDCPGSSSFFKEGYITYSNESKTRLLNVNEYTLAQWGAVSEQTAKEMAEGAKESAKAQISVVSTGIAGPSGGSVDKPVGLVFIACSTPFETIVKKYLIQGDRRDIREATVEQALLLVLEMLKK